MAGQLSPVVSSGSDGAAARSDSVSATWRDVASQIHPLLADGGIETFRRHVTIAVQEYETAVKEKNRREEARRQYLARHGTLVGHEQLEQRPDPKHEHYVDTFRGRIKLGPRTKPPEPPESPKCLSKPKEDWSPNDHKTVKTFHTKQADYRKRRASLHDKIRQKGFPDDEKGNVGYDLEIETWLPEELLPKHDPRISEPLPVPKTEVSPAEKHAALAAIYDAHGRGDEKVDPCGVFDNEGNLDWPSVAPNDFEPTRLA